MVTKYEIHNQLTGLTEEADTYEQAVVLQTAIREAYIASIETLFAIAVLVQNEDGSWTISASDANGNPVVAPQSEF